MGLVDGLNLYRYSRDNPVNFSDPGGTQSQSDWGDIPLEVYEAGWVIDAETGRQVRPVVISPSVAASDGDAGRGTAQKPLSEAELSAELDRIAEDLGITFDGGAEAQGASEAEAPPEIAGGSSGDGSVSEHPRPGSAAGEEVLALMGSVAVGVAGAYAIGLAAGAFPALGLALAVYGAYQLIANFDEIKERFVSDPQFAAEVIGGGVSGAGRRGVIHGRAAAEAVPEGALLGSLGGTPRRAARGLTAGRRVNMPAWKKVIIDMDEVASGHMVGGRRLAPGNKKDVFPAGMTENQVENAIRYAYRYGEILQSQGADRVFVRGPFGSGSIEMWVNRATKTIETAWPKF